MTPEMLKLCRGTKVKVFFPVLVYVFNCDLFEFSTAILDKVLLTRYTNKSEKKNRETRKILSITRSENSSVSLVYQDGDFFFTYHLVEINCNLTEIN